MKKLFAVLLLVAGAAFAEASFDQIENLIEQRNYAAAEQGLEGIIKNHPNSAKAYYAMAQAQAGLGNQEKARHALDKATGLDPDLKFASASNVEKLREAITPQVDKIERAEPSHFWRNLFVLIVLGGIGYWLYKIYTRKDDKDDKKVDGGSGPKPTPPAPAAAPVSTAKAASPAQPQPAPAATPAPSAPPSTNYAAYVAPQPQVVHVHHDSGSDLATGMILGQMMSNSHHDTTRVIEREVIREVPAPQPAAPSTWDSVTSSVSSSWDSAVSSVSSSWDSVSSSSSSWGSDSSSSSSWSDSSSSSSWD